MKPFDILDALSDLPEEYTAFAVQRTASKKKGEAAQTGTKGEIVMKKNRNKASASPAHISKVSVAAIIAVCIGLNAALVYGIARMKQEPGTQMPAETPAVRETDQPYMAVYEYAEPVPTGILVQIFNLTAEDHSAYNPQFIVTQDGRKIADCETPPDCYADIEKGANIQQLCFERLPAGDYTLVNLAADGESEGILGHVDFSVSADFDSMIYIPDVMGMNYDEARALLEEKGVRIERKGVFSPEPEMKPDDVVYMRIPPYKTEKKENSEWEYTHGDGKGYWVNAGDVITLSVNVGKAGETTVRVPYVIGQTFETAKDTLIDLGFIIDKRSAYSDDYPAGTVMEEKVDAADVPAEGMEATVGSYVHIRVSLGSMNAAEPVTVPDCTGMDWETAKRTVRELGLLPGKQYHDAEGETVGTVTAQTYLPGDEVQPGVVIMFDLAKEANDNPMYMAFDIPENCTGFYYIYVRDEHGEVLGVGYPFNPNGFSGKTVVYPDCTADQTRAEAVLVNYETKQEAVIGSYILHPDTAAYETVFEDSESAFQQVQ